MEPIAWQQFKLTFSGRRPAPQSHLLDYLYKPCSIRWPSIHDPVLHMAWQESRAVIPRELIQYFDLSFLASLLLQNSEGDRLSLASVIIHAEELKRLLGGLTFCDALSGVWRSVPVVVVQSGTPYIIHFLVGVIPESCSTSMLPGWALSVLDADSQSAVVDAFAAASALTRRDANLFAFPLTSPDKAFPIAGPEAILDIRGRSLGLPMGLGAVSALLDSSLPSHWLATGDLAKDGKVSEVGSLSEKCRKAVDSGYSLFLHPFQRDKPFIKEPKTLIEARPVSSLLQARVWVECYTSPDAKQEVQRLETALLSAVDFVTNCTSLTSALIDYWRQDARSDWWLKEICKQENLGKVLTKSLEQLLIESQEMEKAAALAALIPIGPMLEEWGMYSPMNAFKWCSLNMSLVKHRGDNVATEKWAHALTPFKHYVREHDPVEYANFINRFYVGALHNQYIFHCPLPSDFLNIYEEEIRCARPTGINMTLGAFHGTVAQNHAFCRSDFSKIRDAIDASQRCFGRGLVEDQRHNYGRGFSCLCAACMDVNDWNGARENLWAYIGATSWDEFFMLAENAEGDRSFAFYYLARYLASAEAAPPVELVKKLLDEYPEKIHGQKGHPWQLYAYNVGRVAYRLGQEYLAKTAWTDSMRICEVGGETMQVMALLPLATINSADMMSEPLLQKTKEIRQVIRNSSTLNKDHFIDLLEASGPQAALQLVTANRKKFFPFNYR